VEALAVWPTENIKTRLQLEGKVANPRFTSFSGGVSTVLRTQGVGGLYTGLVPVLVGAFPKAGVRFGGNSIIKTNVEALGLPIPKTAVNLLAGGVAGLAEAVLCSVLIETVKTKSIEMHVGFPEAVRRIVASEGVRGLYKGVASTMAKQSSNVGLRFMFMGHYRDVVTKNGPSSVPPRATRERFVWFCEG
jgi:solute carrier family 25 citrate transporter 1